MIVPMIKPVETTTVSPLVWLEMLRVVVEQNASQPHTEHSVFVHEALKVIQRSPASPQCVITMKIVRITKPATG